MLYRGQKRPNLDPALAPVYRADKKALTDDVFSADAAHQIIDKYTLEYVSSSLLPSAGKVLDAVEVKWWPGTVFSTQNANFAPRSPP